MASNGKHRSVLGQVIFASAIVIAAGFAGFGSMSLANGTFTVSGATASTGGFGLQTIPESGGFHVLGVVIHDLPGSHHLKAFARALKLKAGSVPWDRALVHVDSSDAKSTADIFIPVNSMREAFDICTKLADIPPSCTPTVASSDELYGFDSGSSISRAALIKAGIEPWHRREAWSKVV